MTEAIMGALIAGVSGALGYLIVTFWIRPILRYQDIKAQVRSDLIFYANAINAEHPNQEAQDRMWRRVEANRRTSADLMACYKGLPCWYRLLLDKRNERPPSAWVDLIGLSNTFDHKDAVMRVEGIRKALRFKGDSD